MKFRPLHLLLLACLMFWTSGAAQYIHECVEHADHMTSAPSRAAKAEHSVTPKPAPASHKGDPGDHDAPDDHDDCPTCQLLAHMSADHVAPPAFVASHILRFERLVAVDCRLVSETVHPSTPIRGPPESILSI